MISTTSKIRHGLVYSDVRPRDRQNFSSCQKICREDVLDILQSMDGAVPSTKGIYVYLKLIECIIIAYCNKNVSLIDRLHYAWLSVFICRFWRVWLNTQLRKNLEQTFSSRFDRLVAFLSSRSSVKIKTPESPKKQNKQRFTITNTSLFSIEINAHSLTYLVLLAIDGQLPFDALSIELLSSQSCENVFRSARAMSGVSSNIVNFTAIDFLRRADKISALQSIKTEQEYSSGLRFPKHHKHANTANGPSSSSSSSSSTFSYSTLRSADIEMIVENAFSTAYELITPLTGEGKLRTSKYKTMTNLSKLIIKHYKTSKLKNLSSQSQQIFDDSSEEIDSEDNDADEGDEIEGDEIEDDEVEDDEDEDEDDDDDDDDDEDDDDYEDEEDEEDEENEEEQDLSHVLLDSSNASFRGMRVKESIDSTQSNSFFKVRRENDTTDVYIHKQTACWVLTNEKSSLSSDRLKRVTQSK